MKEKKKEKRKYSKREVVRALVSDKTSERLREL